MKKNTFIGATLAIIVLAGVVYPSFTSAALPTIADLQAKITELLAQVAALSDRTTATPAAKRAANTEPGQTPALRPQPVPPQSICTTLYRNMHMGMRGKDVEDLQDFLREKGHFSGQTTGYYGPITTRAITEWQTAQHISAVGVVGPLSRGRIKEWCTSGDIPVETTPFSASPTEGTAPLAVTFSTWISGFRIHSVSYLIDFGDDSSENATDCLAPADACTGPGLNTHTYTKEGVYTARLFKVTDPCANNPFCKAAVMREELNNTTITVGAKTSCTKEYSPVCGSKPVTCITTPCNPVEQTYSNSCMMKADNATLLYAGTCSAVTSTNPEENPSCKSWYDGCNTCSRETPGSAAMCTLRACIPETTSAPYCTSYFNTAGNKAPTISSFSGPTTLGTNAPGTWKIKASDPENGEFTYTITWGDEVSSRSDAAALSAPSSAEQSTTFTHEYATAGTYTIAIAVRDTEGKEARTTTTVRVTAKACGEIYAPVCGRPTGCANTCPSGMYCAMLCQLPEPKTYSNSCLLESAGATKLHAGKCTAASGSIY